LGKDQIRYTGPVDDPWFEAHEAHTQVLKTENDGRQNLTTYNSTYPISVVGCASQYQLCGQIATSGTACTPLTGIDVSFDTARKILRNPQQIVTLNRIDRVIEEISSMGQLVTALTGKVLLVEQFGTIELHPLPNDQWIQELNHMFGTLITALQVRNYRYVGGYDARFTPNVTPPAENETWMCGNQIIRRSDYQSFSVLGIAVIIGIGAFTILVDLVLCKVVEWIQKRYRKRQHAYLEWNFLETETLRRTAYRVRGVEMLSGLTSVQPVLDSASASVLKECLQR
jgi:hypothetical protein